MPQQFLTFQFWAHAFFASIGAGLFYMQWGRSNLRAFQLSDFLDTFNLEVNTRHRLELLIFVAIGTVIAMGVAKPANVQQAFSAGLGWTGLAAKPGPARRTKLKV
jgi:hypothetical protein